MKVVSVYDVKAEVYGEPKFVNTKAEAVRVFSDLVKKEEGPIGEHPEDYTLVDFGDWDNRSGVLAAKDPETIITGRDCLPAKLNPAKLKEA